MKILPQTLCSRLRTFVSERIFQHIWA